MAHSALVIPRQRRPEPAPVGLSLIAGLGPTEGVPPVSHRCAYLGLCCGGAAVLCSVLPGGSDFAIALSALGAMLAAVTLRGIRRRGGAARGPVQVWIGFVLLVCVGLLASQAAFASADGRSPGPEPEAARRTAVPGPVGEIPVRIGGVTVGKTVDGLAQVSLAFTVTNGADRARSVEIDFRASAPGGKVVARDSAEVANLAAGQSATSSVFNLVGPGHAPALKRAKFEVVATTWYE